MDKQDQLTPTTPEIAGPPTPEPVDIASETKEQDIVFGGPSPVEEAQTAAEPVVDEIKETESVSRTETFAPETPVDEPELGTSTPENIDSTPEPQVPLGETTEPVTSTPFASTMDSTNFNTETPNEPIPASSPSASFEPAPEKPKKKSNTSSILMLLMFIIALCGVGFGIYGMFLAPAKTVEKVVYQNVEVAAAAIADPQYVYIAEWGLKIKLPDTIDAAHVTYQYQGAKESGLGYSVVKFWGQTNSATATADFADPTKNLSSMTAISLLPESYTCTEGCPTTITLESGEKIAVAKPTTAFSTDEATAKTEADTIDILYKTLNNPENYSAF